MVDFENEVCKRNDIVGVQLQESRDKKSAAFGGESSFENKSGVEADVFEKELQVEGKMSHSSIETDVMACFSAASKKNGNSYGDDISVKSSYVQLKLGKSFQNEDLNTFQSTNESSEPPSFNSLLI